MPSSTSNSNARLPRWPWRTTWLPALFLAAALLLAREGHWRSQDFFTTVRNDRDLWCQVRDAASSSSPMTIALIGESRMQRGVSPSVLARECPGYQVLQLAVGGSSPVPVLKDLAADESFQGIVVCTMTAQFVLPDTGANRQGRYVDYYYTEWNLSKQIDRRIRTALQRTFVIAQLDLSWRVVLRKLLDGESIRPAALREYPDRFATFDFQRPGLDPSALESARQFALEWFPRAVRKAYESASYPQWLAHVDDMEDAVRRIQGRGGRVVFVRPVSDGPVWDIEEQYFPRAKYWNELARRTSAETIHFRDVDSMKGFTCPEWAHLDHEDAIRFTKALAAELRRRGVIE